MRKPRIVLICAAALLLLAAVLWFILRDNDPGVPLGVEHAVTIAYTGPELVVKPYRFGVPVNVRIANVIENDGVRTYDVRYILNTGGEFNVIDYLRTTDGSSTDQLPPFMVKGIESLSQQMDQRIERIEASGIEIWHYYYEAMGLIIALWIGWLLLLIFWKREKATTVVDMVQEPSFLELMEAFIDQIERKTIDNTNKAKMEMLLIQQCREHLGLSDLEMHEAMRRFGKDEKISQAFTKLQQWLHDPNYSISADEMVNILRPFSAKLEESGS